LNALAEQGGQGVDKAPRGREGRRGFNALAEQGGARGWKAREGKEGYATTHVQVPGCLCLRWRGRAVRPGVPSANSSQPCHIHVTRLLQGYDDKRFDMAKMSSESWPAQASNYWPTWGNVP
jgi:hypothetical protein